jgi:hypothetical protein
VQIGNDTSGFVAATLVEKSRRRCIRLDAKPAGAQQPCDGQQERRVVVDDVDRSVPSCLTPFRTDLSRDRNFPSAVMSPLRVPWSAGAAAPHLKGSREV